MEVIFCDNHLLVANKPAGISTQSQGAAPAFHEFAKEWIKTQYHKAGNVFLEPIHRLDKSVSGLVLFARTSKSLSRLNALMRERLISKTYYALVEGVPSLKEATLEHHLIHGEFQALVVAPSHPQAKKASLDYRVLNLKTQAGLSLLEIQLHTGRYHQIRAQLSAIGFPIVGDAKYGAKIPHEQEGIALHHGLLTLTHPVTQEKLSFSKESPFLTTFSKAQAKSVPDDGNRA